MAKGCLWEGSLEGALAVVLGTVVVAELVGLVAVVDPKKYEKHESVGKSDRAQSCVLPQVFALSSALI